MSASVCRPPCSACDGKGLCKISDGCYVNRRCEVCAGTGRVVGEQLPEWAWWVIKSRHWLATWNGKSIDLILKEAGL